MATGVLGQGVFNHGAGYANTKDLANKTVSDKTLKDRVYKIAINPRYYGYQRGLTSFLTRKQDQERQAK